MCSCHGKGSYQLFLSKEMRKIIHYTQNTFRGVKILLSLCALGTQAPLGAGFGNPFASAVGTSLGSSTLGGITSDFFFVCFLWIFPFILTFPYTLYHPMSSSPFVWGICVLLYESIVGMCLREWCSYSLAVFFSVLPLFFLLCVHVRSRHKKTE